MAEYEVQFTLATESGILADYSTNVWSIFAIDLPALEIAVAELKDFYDQIRGLYSSNVEQAGHIIKAYDRSDTPPRAPVLEDTFTFVTAPSGNPLPHEVAICLSFQADKQSGAPQSRRRGRVYIGPLNVSAVDGNGRVAGPFTSDLITGATNFLTASNGATAWSWGVWSTVDQQAVTITNGWVDNAFDTQRRRGREATARTTF